MMDKLPRKLSTECRISSRLGDIRPQWFDKKTKTICVYIYVVALGRRQFSRQFIPSY